MDSDLLTPPAIQVLSHVSRGIISLGSAMVVTTVSVFNANGQCVKNLQPLDNRLDISDLPNGLYHLKMTTPEAVFTQKIVLQTIENNN